MQRTPIAKPFVNRGAAGRALADRLKSYAHRKDVVVLGLSRGGLAVASEVARALDAPLDVFVVLTIGVPQHPELAMGAIASGGVRVLNEKAIEWYRVSRETIEEVVCAAQRKVVRRERTYRRGRPAAAITANVVILVDDGLTTGSTIQAAVIAVRLQQPARVVVAVPVGTCEACDELAAVADEVVCLRAEVAGGHQDFQATTDGEARELSQREFRRAGALIC